MKTLFLHTVLFYFFHLNVAQLFPDDLNSQNHITIRYDCLQFCEGHSIQTDSFNKPSEYETCFKNCMKAMLNDKPVDLDCRPWIDSRQNCNPYPSERKRRPHKKVKTNPNQDYQPRRPQVPNDQKQDYHPWNFEGNEPNYYNNRQIGGRGRPKSPSRSRSRPNLEKWKTFRQRNKKPIEDDRQAVNMYLRFKALEEEDTNN